MSAFAKSQGISKDNLRRWKNKEAKQVDKRKKGALFKQLEDEVFVWVRQRNAEGLKVKDKYILMKMGELRRQKIEELQSMNLEDHIYLNQLQHFRISNGWLGKFKARFNLVSRRVNTTRSLPVGFEFICRQFLEDTQQLIHSESISPAQIVNFDQVPRYFELEKQSTITVKGTKRVNLKKASSSHKRFTFTPAISGDGNFVALHVLFSKLKKNPAVNVNCCVDVNSTGMWNQDILQKFIDFDILPKIRSNNEPVLIILDSYPAHIAFLKKHKDKYETENVFFAIIPKNLTSILQPLDVSLNKSFQDFFEDKYNEYLTKALNSSQGRTKGGNIKVPSYISVSDWVHAWSQKKTAVDVKKAFLVCGLVDRSLFHVKDLHEELRNIFAEENVEENTEDCPKEWFEENGEQWLEDYHEEYLQEHRDE